MIVRHLHHRLAVPQRVLDAALALRHTVCVRLAIRIDAAQSPQTRALVAARTVGAVEHLVLARVASLHLRRLLGEIPSQAGFDHDPNSIKEGILDRFDNVTMVATGASFYRNCFPPASVDLMFSATAMHWFRRAPSRVSTTAEGSVPRT